MAVTVKNIAITELREGTFYAIINLQRNGSAYEVSSRPSDAIALAVRLGCKIFANEDVLAEASILIPAGDEEEEVEKFREFLDNVDPEDFE
jgi:bifunctional DNase/RNase